MQHLKKPSGKVHPKWCLPRPFVMWSFVFYISWWLILNCVLLLKNWLIVDNIGLHGLHVYGIIGQDY